MSAEDSSPAARRRFPVRWRWITAVGTALLVIAVVIALVVVSSARPGESPPPTATSPIPTASGSSSPTPGASPSPTSTGAPGSAPAPDAEGSPPPDSPPPDTAEPPQARPSPSQAPIGSTPDVVPGVEVAIDRLESVDGVAIRPGDVAGPAIRFAVTVANSTDATVSLDTAVVTVDYGSARTPANELIRPGGSAFPPTVEPGASSEGIFIFTVPPDDRDLVRITVDYSVDAAPIVFEGPTPR